MTRAFALARGLAFTLVVGSATSGSAQSAPESAPFTIGGISVSGSIRVRAESWDWFGADPNASYTFLGTLTRLSFGQIRKGYAWNLELAAPALAGLPEPPLGGGLSGLGATYFIANGRHAGAIDLFPKQAYLEVKNLFGVKGQSLRGGRMEFVEGLEAVANNETLAVLRRERLGARLLGNFSYSQAQRSVDGAEFMLTRPATNVTAVAGRLTQGVFQVDGWRDLDVAVAYGSLTRGSTDIARAVEWRLFGLGYRDGRNDVLKTDNRPLAARQADHVPITIATFGGDYVMAVATDAGTADVLVWGAAQTGSWGLLGHRAGALSVEAGWQPRLRLSPWIRGGVDWSSGDGDPNDARHGTFFQVAPTPRIYARFPFFNAMNSTDAFGELVLRPSKRTRARVDVHALRISDSHDLWYQGGGAYQPSTFGYSGLPIGGFRSLATLLDGSFDIALSSRIGVGLYFGRAIGGSALAVSYPMNSRGTLAFTELTVRY